MGYDVMSQEWYWRFFINNTHSSIEPVFIGHQHVHDTGDPVSKIGMIWTLVEP